MRLAMMALAFLMINGSAWAQSGQDNTIRVIQDDGSVVEFKIPENVPSQVAPAPQPAQPAPVVKSEAEADTEKPAAPVQKAAPKAPAKVAKPAKPVKKSPPVATRAESIGRIKAEPQPPSIPPGREIDRDMAVAIALETAPPARGIIVTRETYKDIPVFAVRFKTETGPHDVLVNSRTGEIVPID